LLLNKPYIIGLIYRNVIFWKVDHNHNKGANLLISLILPKESTLARRAGKRLAPRRFFTSVATPTSRRRQVSSQNRAQKRRTSFVPRKIWPNQPSEIE